MEKTLEVVSSIQDETATKKYKSGKIEFTNSAGDVIGFQKFEQKDEPATGVHIYVESPKGSTMTHDQLDDLIEWIEDNFRAE